jgi:hypothetical protein
MSHPKLNVPPSVPKPCIMPLALPGVVGFQTMA